MHFVNKPTRDHATELMHEYVEQMDQNKNDRDEERATRLAREMADVKANNALMDDLNNI